MRHIVIAVVVVLAGCGGTAPPARSPAERALGDAPLVAMLQASRFEDASRAAGDVLARDPGDARAAAVRAIATYEAAGGTAVHDLLAIADKADDLKFFDHEDARGVWRTLLERLDAVDRDLAVVAADPEFSLDLCLACWERDWNRDGRVDARDRRLLEIEVDAQGAELPAGDPRRRPVFRFDVGDAAWARAMLSFQRAAIQLVLAYRWSELDRLFLGKEASSRIVLHLIDPGRVRRARELVLAGVEFADACRDAYLAETDDVREWVPSPRQHDHPIPLPVDAALYATWQGVTGDVRRMLTSEEGLSLREAAALVDPRAALLVPDAYVDLGAMLRDPTDIVLDVPETGDKATNVERILRGLLGHGYRTRMRASPLVARLGRIKAQLDHGEESLGHKLRYLLWLN